MVWQQWALTLMLIINVAIYVGKTGRPREPITGFDAACAVVESALLIWFVISI